MFDEYQSLLAMPAMPSLETRLNTQQPLIQLMPSQTDFFGIV